MQIYRAIGIGVAIIAIATTTCFLIPLQPTFPAVGLDLSWQYALNEATARHLVFGRDVIFTFGPLASVYTAMYHPSTDHLMLYGSLLVALGFSTGCMLLSYPDPEKVFAVALLPFIVAVAGSMDPPPCATVALRDGIFLFLPFILLVLILRVCCSPDSEHYMKASKAMAVLLSVVACSVAILPLIKGSFLLPAFFSGALACAILWTRRPAIAFGFGSLMLAAISIAWVGTGQPFHALAGYIGAQLVTIGGYSEAMAFRGDPVEIVVYVAVSVFLLTVLWRQFTRRIGPHGWTAMVSLAFTLFVVFKAAFVRHEGGHVLIAAGGTLIGGYCVLVLAKPKMSLLVWLVVIFAWSFIDQKYTDPDLRSAWQRLRNSAARAYGGAVNRAKGSKELEIMFAERNEDIRRAVPIAHVEGTVDIYPFELSTIFAHGLAWNPRPVIQSYAAYDARLDALNASHLEGADAPQYVFFQVKSIDDRLASMEDAGSWLQLLSRYSLVGRSGEFFVLARNSAARCASPIQPECESIQTLGRRFRLPKTSDTFLAQIDVQPTLLGKIATALFKPPQLQIRFWFNDGHTESFRYIAAMGRRGFIISPIVRDSSDFAALLIRDPKQYFKDSRPNWVEIAGEAGSSLFWKKRFAVHLLRMELPAQSEAKKVVFDPWIPDFGAKPESSGSAECGIDAINGKRITVGPVNIGGSLAVQGWAAISGKDGVKGDQIFVMLSDERDGYRVARARTVFRPDVNAHFKHPEMGAIGFEAFLDTADLNGTFRLQIFVERQGQFFSCPLIIEVLKTG